MKTKTGDYDAIHIDIPNEVNIYETVSNEPNMHWVRLPLTSDGV